MTVVPIVLVLALAAYGVLESRRHARYLSRIPTRVHVNGTRGKSSVTRLIAAGLRAGGIRTFAKTTGTTARMIGVDGAEEDVFRVGSPNIIEQTRIVRRAAEQGAQALVIECMAVAPELQPVTELRLVRSTVGVITNVRADHLDVMGPDLESVAAALAQTIPVRGHAFTAERTWAPVFEREARRRGTEMHVVADGDGIGEDDLSGFSYLEHAENVRLALAVCAHLGVDRKTALHAMQRAKPDPGVLRRYVVEIGAKRVEFVNAFAANDPDSMRKIWTRLGLDRPKAGVRRIVLANCRGDRLQRSGQIAELVGRDLPADGVVLTGEGTRLVALRAASFVVDARRISDFGGLGAEQVFERVLGLVQDQAVIVGIGNIVGLGQEIVLHFKNRAVSDG
jgi:poly-gamma-glutamate synthase PgsB/CapB